MCIGATGVQETMHYLFWFKWIINERLFVNKIGGWVGCIHMMLSWCKEFLWMTDGMCMLLQFYVLKTWLLNFTCFFSSIMAIVFRVSAEKWVLTCISLCVICKHMYKYKNLSLTLVKFPTKNQINFRHLFFFNTINKSKLDCVVSFKGPMPRCMCLLLCHANFSSKVWRISAKSLFFFNKTGVCILCECFFTLKGSPFNESWK